MQEIKYEKELKTKFLRACDVVFQTNKTTNQQIINFHITKKLYICRLFQ